MSSRPPPHRDRSPFGLERSTSKARSALRSRAQCRRPPHHRFRFFSLLVWLVGWYRRGFTLSTFSRAGGSARDTKRLFARCSTANRWRSQQRGLLPTDHNLTYGCYGQRPPLKVNELGGLQQPKKEKKALPRATAGVGERVRLLPSTHTGLRTTGSKIRDSKGGWLPARPRTLFCSFFLFSKLSRKPWRWKPIVKPLDRPDPTTTSRVGGGRGRFFSTPVFRGGRGGAYSESEGEVVVHTVTVRGSPSPQAGETGEVGKRAVVVVRRRRPRRRRRFRLPAGGGEGGAGGGGVVDSHSLQRKPSHRRGGREEDRRDRATAAAAAAAESSAAAAAHAAGNGQTATRTTKHCLSHARVCLCHRAGHGILTVFPLARNLTGPFLLAFFLFSFSFFVRFGSRQIAARGGFQEEGVSPGA